MLGLDLNENSWSSTAASEIETWGVKNALKQKHPDLMPTATCNKNTNEIPIDGIWTSPGLDINTT